MIGQTLKGRYKIIEDLKKGAFGKTYRAESTAHSPDKLMCIVKQLQPNTGNPFILTEAQRRFEDEVAALEKLGHHPQIPALLDHFEENQEFYIIQEYIEGHDLNQEISNGKAWTEGQVIALLHNVLDALEFIHQHQIVHRQIKPSNLIRRNSDRTVVVTDFGSIKEIETLVVTPRGQLSYSTIGTPGYMPIEQLGGRPRFNSDIYALGIAAIQALTGVSPRQLQRDPKTSQVIWHELASVSPELARIIDKMVRSDYKERYQNATEVLEDLAPFHNIGQILDKRYQILSLLGEGKLGTTFIAADRQRTDTPRCVVKQLKPQASNSFPFWEARSLFDREAQVLHRLGTHDQIPQLLADFQENGGFYLVNEFIEGEDLGEEILPGKQWSEERAIALLQDVLPTLAFVHEQDAIHRDLKPSNLLRRASDGKIVVMDFGGVKQISTLAVDSHGDLKITGLVGTPGYMPKEQCEGNVRPNSDLYALGAIAIQALTGIHPAKLGIDPQTSEMSWRQHAQVSDKLAAILDKMVLSYFRERYQSAKEVLNDLLNTPTKFETKEAETKPLVDAPPPILSSLEKTPQDQVWLQYVKYWQLWVLLALAIIGAAIAAGNYQKTRAQIARADKFVNQANVLIDSLQPEEGRDACNQAIAIKENYAPAWKCSGDALYILERYEPALAAYQKASSLEPNNAKFWNNRGETLYQLHRYKEALNDHDRARQIEPNDISAWNGRGIALIGLQNYDEALVAFEQSLAINPRDPRAWENKGLALEYLKRSDEARKTYESALSAYDTQLNTNPEDLKGWVDRGRVLSKLQRYKEAIASYNKALEINPRFYFAWNAKGSTLYSLQRFEEALEAYGKAVEINPEFYTGWHNRGSVLSAGLQRYEEAIASYNKAVSVNPSFYNAWRDRGIALAALDRYKDAIASFDKALEIEPNDNKSWASRGMALNELKLYDEAIAAFDKALELQPKDHFAWYKRGLALEKLGRDEEALVSYNKAIEIQPNFQVAIETRRALRQDLGR